MVAGTYTVIDVLTEVRLALNWAGTDKWLTDAEINRFVFENVQQTRGAYQFDLITAATTGPTGVYKCFHGNSYGLFLYGPTMTCEADCVYVINCRGSITVTSGTPTATQITVTGALVDFSNLMVELLHWIATHRCQEISESIGSGSLSSQGVQDQITKMIEYWQGVIQLA